MKYIIILTILLLMCNVCIGGDVNIPPDARITYEQQSPTVIHFDSSDSFDEDGFIFKETWVITGFDDDVLDGEIDAKMYQFVAPDAFGERSYSIKLTVEDNLGATNYDVVHVDTMHGEISDISHAFGYEEKVPITIETNDGFPLITVPGFEAVFALIGLLAVVWLIKRDGE